MRLIFSLLLSACAACAPVGASNGVHAWHLQHVVDGDTADLTDGSATVRVRLACVDAPERRQPFGGRSTQALEADLQRKTIGVQVVDHDRYGRMVAYLTVGSVNVNLRQVADGMAWTYPKYCDRPEFYAAETAARAAHAGLWVQTDPVKPWEYRRLERAGK
jgi:micrococcal nuclease